MRFQLLISCNSAAFTGPQGTNGLDDKAAEVARILRGVVDRLETSRWDCEEGEIPLRDANGNVVGGWAFVNDADRADNPYGDVVQDLGRA